MEGRERGEQRTDEAHKEVPPRAKYERGLNDNRDLRSSTLITQASSSSALNNAGLSQLCVEKSREDRGKRVGVSPKTFAASFPKTPSVSQ